jgi:predicted AlkP superfamily pyrophosphatase or phosphodiesterase
MKIKTVAVLLILLPILLFSQKNPYVILVSFDGFRWDYLNRDLTPNLEKVRNDGVSALSLRPAFPSKTFPNHLSIITGMYPVNHGIIANTIYDSNRDRLYKLSDSNEVRDPYWYQGEAFWETAERHGVKTASFYWPGSEVTLGYRRPSYHKNYKHTYPYEERIDGVIEWLQLPAQDRPHFITLYMHETDDFGHHFGPNHEEINKAIKRLDDMAGLLLEKLSSIGMKDSVNVIFVSDHGMTDVSKDRFINIEKLIPDYKCRFEDEGPILQIFPPDGKIESVYDILKAEEKNFKVYLKEDLPEFFHYKNHRLIAPIICIADMGWTLHSNRVPRWKNDSGGNHGYDNNHIDMHGIFLATGPNFKSGYKTGTLWNVDIYPLLCKIFDIYPRSNIDGKAERIEFILK